ncbi:MAG: tryptophan 7-halogenase [Gammaproteobacteria bacterium]|nr:tryptophan 7-halogenase [Gammaproteobacteria bacterium]MDH4255690.1 tryptophan 7-halogenase [Gammaproteobacteria bacterium]MDH5310419.1 tryptophan 7-halogenase [Gammaproteobacteria bacterium]
MKPRRVLIVGGGSAGWMAAAYLDAVLNRDGRRLADVSLIESPDVPRIGVGEATIPSIGHVLSSIGIDEIEFLKRVDGTYKQAIQYISWLDGRGESYYHAFGRFRHNPVDTSTLEWLMSDRSIPFSATISAQPAICDLCLAPKMFGRWELGTRLPYAYHMNALKFADYLCEIATSRGVQHYLDNVVNVEMADGQRIAAVRTRDGRRIEADIFVDCTGFAALLIEKKLGVEWVDCSRWLLADRALAIQVPYEHNYPGYVRPNTQATAVSAGWIWEIPLQNRRAWGYVHASSFVSEDAAEKELRAFVGPIGDPFPARFVPFKVGYRAKSWVGNCVAIGLAAGFIEPLESTGIYLSELAAVMLAEHFPYGDDMEPLAWRFNRIVANRFHEILDFINMHYCLTRRTDTEFWREVQRPERINDRLQAKLDFWRIKPPSQADFEDQFFPGQPSTPLPSGGLPGDHRSPVDTGGVFTLSSYEAILYGMDFLRTECDQWFGADRPPTRVIKGIQDKVNIAPQKLPPHDVYLKRVAGMPDYPPT